MSRGHHVLFERRTWLAHDPNKKLRNMPGLIVPLHHTVHDALHKEIATVPVPNYRLGQGILNIYRDNPDDHMRSATNLLRAVEEAISHPRVRDVEYQLGNLIITSVEAQLPFIEEGLI